MIMKKIFVPPGRSNKPSIMNWITTGIILWLTLMLQIAILLKKVVEPIYRMLFSHRVPTVIRTPFSNFDKVGNQGYTFKSNFVSLDLGSGVALPRMHFLDEGDRDKHVILCLHGEPTWSFVYRKMIPKLVDDGYRVVVPDLIGFGQSDKYTAVSDYTFDLHALSIRKLLDYLNLNEVTLVCQDWGAVIGLDVVKDDSERFSSLVIMNASLSTGEFKHDYGTDVDFPIAVMNSAPFLLWRSLVEFTGTSLPIYSVFRFLIGFSPEIAEGYSVPFPNSTFRAGPVSFPLMVPIFKDDPVAARNLSTQNFLKTWNKPALIMFGDSDPITSNNVKQFKSLLPKAKVVDIIGGTHFLQETHGNQVVDNILRFKHESLKS